MVPGAVVGADASAALADQLAGVPSRQADSGTPPLLSAFVASVAEAPGCAALSRTLGQPNVAAVLSAIFEASPYLRGLIERDPLRLQAILSDPPAQRLDHLIAALHDGMARATVLAEAMGLLRRFKADVALLSALADLGGVWPVMTVTAKLTEAADAAVQSAVRFLFKLASLRSDWTPIDPDAPEVGSGYIVVGMGKYGAYELNYSSDIDLIVFYDPALSRLRTGAEPLEFYVRLTRDLVRLIAERTADGYVFRTDLRLRPDPGATQIALSTQAALYYYETVGQNWERAAFIKARAVAGDRVAGQALLAELAPFIWRKYLDFAAIADVHAMKRQIHAFKGFGGIGVAGHDIKLGPGGIREIEFFVQTQQLIAGGRQPGLRVPATLDALEQLVSHGWIEYGVARALEHAYLYLRTLEHRIQMVADEQTHRLPTDRDELARLAGFAGDHDLETFASDLTGILQTVQGHYARLFEASPELTRGAFNMVFAGAADDPATLEALASLGYSQPRQVLDTVRGWHHGRFRAMRSPAARERLTQVQPVLIEALAQTAGPDQALANFDRFLADLPSGVQLFALLRTKPGLLQLLADIMGSAPRLARILSRNRRLFDAVLDPHAFGAERTIADYKQLVRAATPPAAGSEAVLDAARVVGSEQAFLIGIRILAGSMAAGQAGAAYATLADALIGSLQARIEADLASIHGSFAHGAATVVAMGKLGGREMTAASDLDILLIYDAPAAALTGEVLSDGAKPLSAPQYYARLTQRLVAALSAPTSQGRLYEVDLRLRPSGQKGPLATSLASFIDYQNSAAWTWEHMALTRARVVSGPPAARAKVTQAIAAVLAKPRDAQVIAADVREMRARIVADKGTNDIWDLKQVRGGLVDLEFIVQYLQLVHARAQPAVLSTNTAEAVARLARAGVLTAADGQGLADAAQLLASLTGLLRLMADGPFDPKTASAGLKARLVRAGETPGFPALEAHLKEALDFVHAAFERLI